MLTDTSVNFTKKTKEENFMNELITVNYDSEQPTVLGRDLHEALGIKTAYKDWFPRMCEYDSAWQRFARGSRHQDRI